MKITGGTYRGIQLPVVGNGVRPTTDRNRESLFSTLAALVPEARVLDLFAGAGSLGLEALSRGAASAVFVEQNVKVAASLERRVQSLHPVPQAKVTRANALSWFNHAQGEYELIFADPPYEWEGRPWLDRVCAGIVQSGVLAEEGLLIFERAVRDRTPIPDGWELLNEKGFGDSAILFLEPVES